jgi:hypothetical protein
VAELVDALDSKSSVRKDVRVRVPPLVHNYLNEYSRLSRLFIFHAEVVELVDTHVSGACVRKDMGVRVPPSALSKKVEKDEKFIVCLSK